MTNCAYIGIYYILLVHSLIDCKNFFLGQCSVIFWKFLTNPVPVNIQILSWFLLLNQQFVSETNLSLFMSSLKRDATLGRNALQILILMGIQLEIAKNRFIEKKSCLFCGLMRKLPLKFVRDLRRIVSLIKYYKL